MTVDLDAIARRGRCNASNLRTALPLLEQGYAPPFLARYRRDELGGVDEASLWSLAHAVDAEQTIARRRDELYQIWEATPLADPAMGQAIRKANSKRILDRLAMRLKLEKSSNADDPTRLAVRLLNPQKGDGDDIAAIAGKVEGIENAEAAVTQVDEALGKRLAGDPRLIHAAVRWLAKNARIYIASVSDPHGGGSDDDSDQAAAKSGGTPKEAADTKEAAANGSGNQESKQQSSEAGQSSANQNAGEQQKAEGPSESAPAASGISEQGQTEQANSPVGDVSQPTKAAEETAPAEEGHPQAAETPAPTPGDNQQSPGSGEPAAASPQSVSTQSSDQETSGEQATPAEPAKAETTTAAETAQPNAESASAESGVPATNPSGTADSTEENAKAAEGDSPAQPAPVAKADAGEAAASSKAKAKPAPVKKKQKKISPRQRRRRWLVSVLKPLAGKRLSAAKLSSFQLVMLGRALRSQVVECLFEYDAKQLVDELQRTAVGFNRQLDQKLRDTVMLHEANIREAAEAAWWDELQEQASTRLVSVAADNLRAQVNRGNVDAKVVMSVDAVGPRTAATTIVAADGRILHTEDIPCQLSAALRAQAVAKMGELIHNFQVDLIVVSNGPARRACMVAIKELISQSPDSSLRWTLADRSGADAYAGGSVGDDEMRSTPRRFRAASWIAFSVLRPAQALAKVDPLKLRLGSFQRELADDALSGALEDVILSGASRGGVDANAATTTWLSHLPGIGEANATVLEQKRSEGLFKSRQELEQLDVWKSAVERRQALPFLRVFGSEETLDGTLIHPEDYALAKKLAGTLEIELPPATPPGYEFPKAGAAEESGEESQTSGGESAETAGTAESGSTEDASSAAQPTSAEQTSESEADKSATSAEVDSEGETAESGKAAQSEEENADPEAATQGETGDSGEIEPAAEPNENAGPDEPQATDASQDGSSASPQSDAADETAVASELPGFAKADQGSVKQSDADASAAKPEPVVIPEPIRRPRPDQAKVDKCIKEWQIGPHRTKQLIDWLCDPFGDNDPSGVSPAVLTTMPTLADLKPGDQVIGVVVGVMPFGVFLELAPDCSGLIHVSRLAENFVEDVHEAVQVGDVITAWVTGTDQKRRRVALSGVSPEREAEIAKDRDQRQSQRGGRGGRGGKAQGQPRSGGRGRGGQPARDAQPTGKQSGGKPARGRGGQRDQRGRSRDRGHSGRRGGQKKPDSYRVASSKPAEPISDAMKKGEEPLRSFGDLMQFFSGPDESQPKETGKSKDRAAIKTPPPEQPQKEAQDTPETPAANTGAESGESSSSSRSPDQPTAPANPTPPESQQPEGSAEEKRPAALDNNNEPAGPTSS